MVDGAGGSGGAGTGAAGGSAGAASGGGGSGGAGGQVADNNNQNSGGDAYAKAMAENARLKEESRVAKEALAKQETDKLKQNQQWKELAEANEKKVSDLTTQLTTERKAFLERDKFVAIKDAATKLGLLPAAVADLNTVDLSDVQIETTSTGRVNILGADKFAERLKTIRPHWFSTSGAPNVNTSTTRVAGEAGQVTTKDILTAEKEAKKSGDYSKVSDLMKRFNAQKRA